MANTLTIYQQALEAIAADDQVDWGGGDVDVFPALSAVEAQRFARDALARAGLPATGAITMEKIAPDAIKQAAREAYYPSYDPGEQLTNDNPWLLPALVLLVVAALGLLWWFA